ncbi:MAG: tRNA 4-thiouridine(8) synthase ThiI [Deltaproteobacteria bacterium]|nr:MAG: tRNA 4-thiouridine(8) synthase ThiI [Deltaproteobacteria bacterium]
MIEYTTLALLVDELWLKGKNRGSYFRALKENIELTLKAWHKKKYRLVIEAQRFLIRSETPFSDETMKAIARMPGLQELIPVREIPLDYDRLLEPILEELDSHDGEEFTFKVETLRSFKKYPKNSMEISRHMGHLILQARPKLKVNVRNPQVQVNIRVLPEHFYISTRSIKSPGGLPVGTNGHLITMLSGGFDSPVASYLMSKRGCTQTFVFFYAYPFVGEEVKDKIIELAKVLATYQSGCKLWIVPFGKVQKKIAKTCRETYRTIFFRKYMVDCSNLLCERLEADALLTGDSLGQVSSQTIGNISLVDQTSRYPILRPLIGFNKKETIALAQKVGTHDISVIPHDDACSMFAPKFPVIRPKNDYWHEYIEENDFTEDLNAALDQAEVFRIGVNGMLTSCEISE